MSSRAHWHLHTNTCHYFQFIWRWLWTWSRRTKDSAFFFSFSESMKVEKKTWWSQSNRTNDRIHKYISLSTLSFCLFNFASSIYVRIFFASFFFCEKNEMEGDILPPPLKQNGTQRQATRKRKRTNGKSVGGTRIFIANKSTKRIVESNTLASHKHTLEVEGAQARRRVKSFGWHNRTYGNLMRIEIFSEHVARRLCFPLCPHRSRVPCIELMNAANWIYICRICVYLVWRRVRSPTVPARSELCLFPFA